ncbi:MAG: hypothetical protein GWN58_27145, partial [Anaerolineae bacterium]|nr:hypothetical protein [Anaerolineae bacterium]
MTESATLQVTLQEDVGGKPWGPSLLPEPIQLRLERPAAGGSMWTSAPLPAAFTFQADQIYWLIVNSAAGDVNWAVEAADEAPPAQITRDDGLSWQAIQTEKIDGPVTGVYRLRAELPEYRQPIKLQVGGHEVSLRSLDALGKVDFVLNLPEVADAFNAVVADAIESQAGLTERVANGDFTRWTRIERRARRVASPAVILASDDGQSAGPVAVTPDGSRVYAVLEEAIQVITNNAEPSVSTPFDVQVSGLAISPDGLRCYIAWQFVPAGQEESWLAIVEVMEPLRQGQQLRLLRVVPPYLFESTAIFEGTAIHLAVAPDCSYVYLATRLTTYEPSPDTPVLIRLATDDTVSIAGFEQIDTQREVNETNDVLALAERFDFTGGQDQPRNLLIAPDGRRAYIAVERGVLIADLEGWQSLGHAWFDEMYPPRLDSLALSSDGTRLYALAGGSIESTPENSAEYVSSQTLLVLDTALLDQVAAGGLTFDQAILTQLSLGDIPISFSFQWSPSIVTPDDTRLLISFTTAEQLMVIDTTTITPSTTIDLAARPLALTVTSDSRRAFVLERRTDPIVGGVLFQVQIQAVELDVWTADDWALTVGRVAPVYVPEAEQPTARLGSPLDDTGLSQVFPVSSGQEYELRFRARAGEPGAIAELFWLSQGCGLLDELSVDIQQPPCGAGLQWHAIRGTAPPDVDQAELRFIQPAEGYMLLDDVSFMAPVEATANGDFSIQEEVVVIDPVTNRPVIDPVTNRPMTVTLPQGWRVEPVAVDGIWTELPDGGIRLTALTASPAMLIQELPIKADKPFHLEFQAFPYGQPSVQGNPRVELRWIGSQAKPVTYELVPQRFDVTVLDGTVPADATGAELVFIQPPGGKLDVIRVRLSQP